MAFPTKVIPLSDAFKQWLNATFSPKVHDHDDKYSLLGHTHPDMGCTINENVAINYSQPSSIDESCDVNILKNANNIPYSYTINGTSIDVKANSFDHPSIDYVTIGRFVIVCGTTPKLNPKGTVNQFVRIKIPNVMSTLFSANLTAINYFDSDRGVESSIQFVAFYKNWLYVYIDGNGDSYNVGHVPVGVSFTLFGKQ